MLLTSKNSQTRSFLAGDWLKIPVSWLKSPVFTQVDIGPVDKLRGSGFLLPIEGVKNIKTLQHV